MNKNLDAKENQIKIMENFVDKYTPIRVQQQISETIQHIGTHSMKQKLENHEMEKYKELNEDLLVDEENAELTDLCNKILKDLQATTEQYRKIAKKKGIKYEIRGRKEAAKNPNADSSSTL